MPELRLTSDARQELARLPESLRAAVAVTIDAIRADPWASGKALRGRMRPLRSARVGRYRILYTIEGPESAATVVVRDILHRSVAYRGRRPRA